MSAKQNNGVDSVAEHRVLMEKIQQQREKVNDFLSIGDTVPASGCDLVTDFKIFLAYLLMF